MEQGNSTSLIRNPWVTLLAGLVVGVLIGWWALGWWLFPVSYENGQAWQLGDLYKEYYLKSVARDWAQQGGSDAAAEQARRVLGSHPQDLKAYVDSGNTKTLSPEEKQQIDDMLDAAIAREKVVEAGGGGASAGGPSWVTYLGMCLLGLVLVVGVGGTVWFMTTRRAAVGAPMTAAQEAAAAAAAQAAQMPQEQWGGRATPPVAQFTSKYIGTDVGYDDSFSIDTQAGDFLGECGVGVSEIIGTGEPKKITALEVWLFDKNDIRTVTKVLMSEHAFYDDALRAKLAPKGEAILTRVGEVVLLETASLEVSARVIDLEYGSSANMPPNSYFSKVTIELSAWPKEVMAAAPA